MKSLLPTPIPGSLTSSLRHAFWFGVVGLAAIALSVIGMHSFERRVLNAVFETRETMRLAREARILSLDQETGLRGYLLSGNTLSLAPATAANAGIGAKLDSLMRLSEDRPSQRDRVLAIRNSLARWQRGYVVPTLAEAEGGRWRPTASGDLSGKELFDGVTGAFNSFLRAQERRYGALVRFHAFVQRFGLGLILLEIFLVIGILANLSRRSAAQANRLLEQREQLEEQAIELEHQTHQLQEQAAQLEEQSEQAQHTLERLYASNKDLESTVVELRAAQAMAAEASAAGHQTQSLLDSVLESAPIGFGMFDRELRYTVVNEAMAIINGMPAAELVGKSPSDLGTPKLAAAVEKMLTGVLNTGLPVLNVPLSGCLIAEPTLERHWLMNYFPIGGGSEQALGVGILATEVSDRRRLEEQLLQAQKMEAVGRLAGGVAHDFNNMLTAIKSYSELLLEDLDPQSTQHADVSEISKAAERATALTRQLLAFSRQQVMRPRLMDLNATIGEIGGILRPLVGASIRIDTVLDPELWCVIADPGELERVITNLVINSRDAMPNGGRLTVETSNVYLDDLYVSEHPGTSPGPYVMLAVTDTGHGMNKEVRDRLFEPFFTTKEIGKGTGLGLSSAYGVVKQSNGHIWVYSEPGRGTTFKVYLPRAYGNANDETGDMPGSGNRGGETILLVEDDEAVRAVAARILRRQQYTVLEASNGVEALAICNENGFDLDLIVTDIVMPEMDGAELASRIKAARPDAKILFTSGYTEDSAIRQSILHPGAAFLEKPFTVEGLSRKTREVLDSARCDEVPA